FLVKIEIRSPESAVRQGIADHPVSGQVRGKTRNRQEHEQYSTKRFHSSRRLQQTNIGSNYFVSGVLSNFLNNVFKATRRLFDANLGVRYPRTAPESARGLETIDQSVDGRRM